jgi:phospholipid/cholesterol/gamma-HCH transport system substrate-binding protein
MKISSYTRAVIVGIFVFLGIAIFILAVLTLGGQHKTFEKSIVVKAIFNDVNGLQKGNNVWFSGVKVGTIKNVILFGNERVEVDINIEQKSRQFIPKDAKAKVGSDGLIGNKIIVIYGGTSTAPKVQTGDVLGVEKLPGTDEMFNTLAKNNDNLLQITNDFKMISKKLAEGNGTVGKLLTDETLINELNATSITFRKVSQNIEALTANAANYTSRLNTKGSLASDLVSDTVIFSTLRSTITQLQMVSVTADSVISNLKTTSNSVNGALNNSKAPIGMLLHDEQAAANIKVTLQNLQGGTKKLDEDLEALQHNFLFRGFFKKKAKRQQADTTHP